ncbi:uncharacterized protein [Nicotiana sylvestris]|uniref:uncharacterized protein n=1 Tax=Nicotiana sylvestris TaxID=4096 RepID=UPI00388CC822
MELLKDYDIDIQYHPGNASVVADALRKKFMDSFGHLESCQRPLEGGLIVQNRAESLLVGEVKEKQYDDPLLVQLKEGIHKHKTTAFYLGMDDGTLWYQGKLCVPNVDGLRERIMAEAHTSRYFVYPGSTKMYHNLKEVYWWNEMKRNVEDFVEKCPNY